MDACPIGTLDCLVGVPEEESGYEITNFQQSFVDPGIDNPTTDKDETPIGFYARAKRFSDINITGQVCGDPAALPFQFPCAGTIVVSNLIEGYDITTGGVYMGNLTFTFSKGQQATFTVASKRFPHIP